MNNLRIVAYCKAHERDDGSWAGGDTELGTIEDVDIIPPIGSDISTKWGLQTVRRANVSTTGNPATGARLR